MGRVQRAFLEQKTSYRTSETGEWILIDGATKDKYEFTVTADMIGWQFRCLVRNDDGQVYSDPATLQRK